MTNVMKKVGALLLTLAMLATMIPMVSANAFAAENGMKVYVGLTDVPAGDTFLSYDTGITVTKEWMEANTIDAQIFPFAAGQGKTWQYVVAEGPSYTAVIDYLCKKAGYTRKQLIAAEGQIDWVNADQASQAKFLLDVADLANATTQFYLVDQDGNKVNGGFNGAGITDVTAKPMDNTKKITPIISTKSASYATYEEAEAALKDGSWKNNAKTSIMPLVGGKFTNDSDAKLKVGGEIKMGAFNFTGKFAMKDLELRINIKNAKMAPAKVVGVTAKNVKSKTAKLSWKKGDSSVKAYQVAYSTKKASGYKIKTVKSNSCSISKLIKGKTYYFKVRAYKVVDGKKIYGEYSTVKAIKIKK